MALLPTRWRRYDAARRHVVAQHGARWWLVARPWPSEATMQQIRWALIVVASVAVIAMGGCGHNVHVQFDKGRTRVHVGSQDRPDSVQQGNSGDRASTRRGPGRHP